MLNNINVNAYQSFVNILAVLGILPFQWSKSCKRFVKVNTKLSTGHFYARMVSSWCYLLFLLFRLATIYLKLSTATIEEFTMVLFWLIIYSLVCICNLNTLRRSYDLVIFLNQFLRLVCQPRFHGKIK